MSTKSEADAKVEWGRKIGMYIRREETYLKAGDWPRKPGEFDFEIHFLGTVGDLHGTVCTCCKDSVNFVEPTHIRAR